MKQIPLTKGYVAIVDDSDYERIAGYRWHSIISRNGRIYACNYSVGYMHRVLMDSPHGLDIDHINRDGLDNRRSNLRIATRSQNSVNSVINGNNTSGFRGVTWHKRGSKWLAQIGFESGHIYLGLFASSEEAARAYDAKAIELFGEFALTNFAHRQ